MSYFKAGIGSPHAQLEMAHRRLDDAVQVQLFGFNRTIGTSYETIWNNGGGLYTFPSAALTLSVVSSSASDTMSVLLQGLDADYAAISEIITLNGTTPVTTTTQFFRLNDVVILSGNNVGNITISNGGTTYGYVEAAHGTEQAIIYTTPADHSLYVFTAQFTSGTVNPNKYITSRGVTRSSTGRIIRFWESTFQQDVTFNLAVPFRVPPKTDFTIEAKSSSGDNELSIYIGGVLLEEDL